MPYWAYISGDFFTISSGRPIAKKIVKAITTVVFFATVAVVLFPSSVIKFQNVGSAIFQNQLAE
jgi:hypothetical protein